MADVRLFAVAAVLLALVLAVLLARSRRAPSLTRAYARFPVVARTVANHGARPVIFLTVSVSTASLPTGAHVKLRAKVDGELVVRSYTPTRFHSGTCEILFRVYENGPLSTHLSRLRVGDSVEMMGPTGLERYGARGPGTFSRGEREWRGITHVALVSGGTGITPMLQIANHVLQDGADATALSLASFTSSVADFILEDTLRELAARSRGALTLTFVASAATAAERRERPDVRVASMRTMDAAGLRALLGAPAAPTTMVCVCGPDAFSERARALCGEAGYENVLVW